MNKPSGPPRGYGRAPLTPLNLDSQIAREGLLGDVEWACARWKALAAEARRPLRLLDLGCGSQPYRALIEEAGLEYYGADWPRSIHPCDPARTAQCDLSQAAWPFEDSSFDAILCTEVLEHIPDPHAFLAECRRVARPGAELLLTAPLLWPEHETPFDYFRYTRHGLQSLLRRSRWEILDIRPRGGWHASFAQMLGLWATYGFKKPWSYLARLAAWPLAALLRRLDRPAPMPGTQGSKHLPMALGYTALARRPAE